MNRSIRVWNNVVTDIVNHRPIPAVRSTTTPSTQPPAPTTIVDNLPVGGVPFAAAVFVLDYLDAGYCTPNGAVGGCAVETDLVGGSGNQGGAYRTAKYYLCPPNSIDCAANDEFGTMSLAGFSSVAAANAFLEANSNDGGWAMGWQLNQWAIQISADVPLTDLSRIERSLTSAAVIVNGQPYRGTSAPLELHEVYGQ